MKASVASRKSKVSYGPALSAAAAPISILRRSLGMSCKCGAPDDWKLDLVSRLYHCPICRRCSGRGESGAFDFWPVGRCYQCGDSRCRFDRSGDYWCAVCGANQYNRNGLLDGNRFEDERRVMSVMSSIMEMDA